MRGARAMRPALRAAVVAIAIIVAALSIWVAAAQAAAQRADASRQASEYTPPPPVTPPAAQLPIVAVIGDGSTSGAASGVSAQRRWPAVLARANRVDVQTFAAADAGYTARGSDGRTFYDEASRVPTSSQVVVLFGGSADAETSQGALSRAVGRTIGRAQIRAPGATVVLVGPAITGGAGASQLRMVRSTLQGSASAFQLRFIDPTQQAWLAAPAGSADDLDQSDQDDLAQRFETLVTQVLRAVQR